MIKGESMKFPIFIVTIMIIIMVGFIQFSDAATNPVHVYHFNKGVVDEQSPFAGEVLWTLINGNEGAIVHSSDHGVVVVRFSLSYSDVCIESIGVICLDGKVTQFKNTDSHNEGEDLKIIIDATNNEEIISMINGPLAGVDVKINLTKIRTPEAEEIAKRFVFSAPTFSYDGMPESFKVGDIIIRESFPPQFVVPIDFDSLHGGYGDRTEQIVTQVITPHTIRVTVVNGMVTSAIIDGKWDELNQIQLPLTPTNGPSETVSHGGEAVDYVSLIDNLRANDATVNPEGEIEQPFFSVTGFSIQVNGSSVQVFEYNSAEDAKADASLVSPDGSRIGTTMPFWVDDPHFYYKEKIIVLYVGDDPAIEELLESVLGSQFAGR